MARRAKRATKKSGPPKKRGRPRKHPKKEARIIKHQASCQCPICEEIPYTGYIGHANRKDKKPALYFRCDNCPGTIPNHRMTVRIMMKAEEEGTLQLVELSYFEYIQHKAYVLANEN